MCTSYYIESLCYMYYGICRSLGFQTRGSLKHLTGHSASHLTAFNRYVSSCHQATLASLVNVSRACVKFIKEKMRFVYGTAPNSSCTQRKQLRRSCPRVCRLLITTENCFTSSRSQVFSSLVFRHYVYSGVFEVDQWEIRNDIRDAYTWVAIKH